MLDKLLGSNANRSRQYLRARAVDPLDANGRFERYLRARMESDDEGRLVVQALKQQDTSVLSALSSANALIRRLAGTQAAASGEIVDVIALDRS